MITIILSVTWAQIMLEKFSMADMEVTHSVTQ